MTREELISTLSGIEQSRQQELERLSQTYSEEELRSAMDFLRLYGDGKTTLEQAAKALRCHRSKAQSARRKRVLCGGAMKALLKKPNKGVAKLVPLSADEASAIKNFNIAGRPYKNEDEILYGINIEEWK